MVSLREDSDYEKDYCSQFSPRRYLPLGDTRRALNHWLCASKAPRIGQSKGKRGIGCLPGLLEIETGRKEEMEQVQECALLSGPAARRAGGGADSGGWQLTKEKDLNSPPQQMCPSTSTPPQANPQDPPRLQPQKGVGLAVSKATVFPK